jgi:hypothetical protein
MLSRRHTGLAACCAECAATGLSGLRALAECEGEGECVSYSKSTAPRFDLSKYEYLFNPLPAAPPTATVIDPQWEAAPKFDWSTLVGASPAERMFPQTQEAAALRAKEQQEATGGLMTWVAIGGGALLLVLLLTGGRR